MTLERYCQELDTMISGRLTATKDQFAAKAAANACELEKNNWTDDEKADAAILAGAFRDIQAEMKRRVQRLHWDVRTLSQHLQAPLATAEQQVALLP
jgi:hypothetical protein